MSRSILKTKLAYLSIVSVATFWVFLHAPAQEKRSRFEPSIPRVWDDEAIATLEVPLANPMGSPRHISSDYYYRIPVRPIYKSYPVYAPGHEPPNYMEWLRQQDPEVLWDESAYKPNLSSREDWIAAGRIVFNTPIYYTTHRIVSMDDVRNPKWYQATGVPGAKDGTVPFVRYVIRKKGEVELGDFACGFCHTRVMPEGSVLEGVQGNFPFEKSKAWLFRSRLANPDDARKADADLRHLDHSLFAAPWLKPDPSAQIDSMTTDQLIAAHAAMLAEVTARHQSGLFDPLQIPDLIGVKDRRYLDHTGLQQHGSIADLMRYAALNQGADDLASYDGFVPADFHYSTKRPEPGDPIAVGGRYSDEQLYALAMYLYALEPPPNPNKFDALARRGKKIFETEGCGTCHTPPLYTNNKLTPAEGFRVPPEARQQFDIAPFSVGTDPNMTLKTRRGTGYYKVPSLKGVWYRSMFGHSGWCASLEDWFDPKRLDDNYEPTGFKPYGAKSYPVKGHPFGLDLSEQDRRALIAFLKTL
ncbi:c-type cytochrome [Acidicapsa acidisoli]|uniref:c-type cytochrome n=1 Tax=Acidicapsa acidisoli TaxID=1615681 RepID=UPI0021DFB4E2|nr:c-type cytochrome [Acidicapsa acidisoli]